MPCRSSPQPVYCLTFLSINGCDPNIFRKEQIACTIPVPQLPSRAEAVKLVRSSLLQITMGTDSLTWH